MYSDESGANGRRWDDFEVDEYSHEMYVLKHIDFNNWYELEWVGVEDDLLESTIMFNGHLYKVTAFVNDYKGEDNIEVVDVELIDKKYN